MAIRTLIVTALAAGLTACAGYQEPTPVVAGPVAPAASVVDSRAATTPSALATLQAGTFRPGNGILESIGLITLPASAAAGGTVPPGPVPGPYRLTIRMDDGNVQTVQADTRALLVGDRVRITEDGRLIRP